MLRLKFRRSILPIRGTLIEIVQKAADSSADAITIPGTVPPLWYRSLQKETERSGLICLIIPQYPSDVEKAEAAGIDGYEIGPEKITDMDLIRICAQTGKPLMLTIGCDYEPNIRSAVEACLEEGCGAIVLMINIGVNKKTG